MTTHTKLSPSGSAKWLDCGGSLEKEKDYPNKSNPAADKGSVTHELSQFCYQHERFPSSSLGQIFPPYKTPVDEEMIEWAERYLEYVRNLEHDETETFVETTFNLQPVYMSESKEKGTADAIIVDYQHKVIHVIDLKTGGTRVFAKDNSQLSIYGCGAINFLEFGIDDIDEYETYLHIFQPSIENVDLHKTTVKELKQWMNDVVRPQVKLIESGNAPVVPGEKQCQWCRARFDCEERRDWAFSVVTEDFEDLTKPLVFKDKKALTNEKLGEILTHAKGVKKFFSDMEKYAHAKAMNGEKIKDHKIIMSKKNEKLTDSDKLIDLLHEMDYEDEQIMKPAEVKSKTDLKKLMKKTFSEVAHLWQRPPGDKILVHVSEKGEEIVIDPTEGFEQIGE